MLELLVEEEEASLDSVSQEVSQRMKAVELPLLLL